MLTTSQIEELRAAPRSEDPNNLRRAMRMANVTQEQLEASTGIVQAQVSSIVRGGYSRLPLERARALSRFFGCAIEDLFPEPVSRETAVAATVAGHEERAV